MSKLNQTLVQGDVVEQEETIVQRDPKQMRQNSEIVKKIKEKIFEGYNKIKPEDNVILVVGNTGAGKSTLVNYLAGTKLISEKKGFGKLVITAPNPITPEMSVSHKPVSETAIPNSWKDTDNNVIYWDCPGFGDNRGPVQEIANAFYIKKLFDCSKNIKVLAITTQASFEEGRGVEFTNLMTSLSDLFIKAEDFAKSIVLVVTKADPGTQVGDVQEAISEILTSQFDESANQYDAEIAKNVLSDKHTQLLKHLADNPSQISLFSKPTKPGEISGETRDVIKSAIDSAKPVSGFEVNISVSDKSKLRVSDLIIAVNDQIWHQLSKYTGLIDNKAKDLANIDLNSEGLVQSIIDLKSLGKQMLEVTKNVKTSEDFITKLESMPSVSGDFLQQITEDINCLKFCDQITNFQKNVYSVKYWVSPFQSIEAKINSGSGYINSTKGYLKNMIHRDMSELFRGFFSSVLEYFRDLSSNAKDIEKMLELKNYVQSFISLVKSFSDSDTSVDLSLNALEDILNNFSIPQDDDRTFLMALKKHVAVLNELDIDDLSLYRNELFIRFSRLDFSDQYQQLLSDHSQKCAVEFKGCLDNFIEKSVGEFSDLEIPRANQIKKSWGDINLELDKNLDLDQVKTIDHFIKFLGDDKDLQQAKSIILKLSDLIANGIQVELPNNGDFTKNILYSSKKIINLYESYSQQKVQEFNKSIGNLTDSFVLKLWHLYSDFTKWGKIDEKSLFISEFEDYVSSSSKKDFLSFVVDMRNGLGQFINLEELPKIIEIVSNFNNLELPGKVLNTSYVSGSVSKLLREIHEDAQKNLAAEDAKNEISILLHGIEGNLDKIIKQSGTVTEIGEKLKKLDHQLSGIISCSSGKKAPEFTEIIKNTISDEYFYERKSVINKHLRKVSEASDLVIDHEVLSGFVHLSDKVGEEVDWYESLPEFYQVVATDRFWKNKDPEKFKFITKENFRGFLDSIYKFSTSIKYISDFNYEAKKAEELNSLLEATLKSHFRVEANEQPDVLSVVGNNIKLSEVKRYITDSIKTIKIKSFCSVEFDADLKAQEANLVIISPKWVVNNNVKIDLSGLDALHHKSAASDGFGYNVASNGSEGDDGLPGIPGGNGGNFYGVGSEFWGLDKLCVDVSGGDGGNGQDGGDGADGLDNRKHATVNKFYKKDIENTSGVHKNYWLLRDYGAEDCRFIYDKIEHYYGFPGGNGGDGGRAGAGGYGGHKGSAKILCGTEEKIFMVLDDVGNLGRPGQGGSGGKGGKFSNDVDIYRGYACDDEYSHIDYAKYGRKSKKYSPDGLSPKELVTEDGLSPDIEYFDILVNSVKQEYLSSYDNDSQDHSKFYFKVQKPSLKIFFDSLSMSGSGFEDTYISKDYADYYGGPEFFDLLNKYYAQGIDNMLKLRLKNLSDDEMAGIGILPAKYLHTGFDNNAEESLVYDLIESFSHNKDTLLVPYNIHGKHWVGMVAKKINDVVEITYMDSENREIPNELISNIKSCFTKHNYTTNFVQEQVEFQLQNNCGSELIENIVFHLTQARLPQEGVVEFYMNLFEEDLIKELSGNIIVASSVEDYA